MSDEHVGEKSAQYETVVPASADGKKYNSPLTRLGIITALLIFGCFAVIVSAIGFLGYMWYGDSSHDVWKKIVLNNFTARAITLTSIAIRVSVALQGAFCLSMVVAIAMERSQIPVSMLGDASMVRSGGNTGTVSILKDIVWTILRKGRGGGLFLYGLIVPMLLLLLVIINLSQLTSTALLSDVSLQYIPGFNQTASLLFNYDTVWWYPGVDHQYINVQLFTYTTWTTGEYHVWTTRNPLNLPTFAEYSEPPVEQENVVDTGVSLRAYLPFEDAAARQSIRNYTGKVALMDSRVTCQLPKIENLEAFQILSENGVFIMKGNVSPTTITPRMDNRTFPSTTSVPFYCLVDEKVVFICQLRNDAIAWGDGFPYSGGLVSEFRQFPTIPGQDKSGAAYLLGTQANDDYTAGPEWYQEFVIALKYQGGGLEKRQPLQLDANQTALGQYGFTLCYAALDVEDRVVEIYSDTNRTELATSYELGAASNNTKTPYYLDVDAVQNRLVSYPANISIPSKESRGLLNIKPQDKWWATESAVAGTDGPIKLNQIKQLGLNLTDFNYRNPVSWIPAALQLTVNPSSATFGNCTAPTDSLYYLNLGGLTAESEVEYLLPQLWVHDIFMSTLIKQKNAAVALQSVLTSLAGIAYYDYLRVYDKRTNATYSSFELAETPGGPLGRRRTETPRGLVAVLIVLAFHTVLCIAIMIAFLTYTRLTRLGDGWQMIAHISSSENTRPALAQAASTAAQRDAALVEMNNRKVGSGLVYLAEEGDKTVFKYK